jgi:hypothetical protein
VTYLHPADQLCARPWPTLCATTGRTYASFIEEIDRAPRSSVGWAPRDAPVWVKRAAIHLTRSYASSLPPQGLLDIIRIVDLHRRGRAPDLTGLVSRMEKDRPIKRPAPQYEPEPDWVWPCALRLVDYFGIQGLSDPGYFANVINGSRLDMDGGEPIMGRHTVKGEPS